MTPDPRDPVTPLYLVDDSDLFGCGQKCLILEHPAQMHRHTLDAARQSDGAEAGLASGRTIELVAEAMHAGRITGCAFAGDKQACSPVDHVPDAESYLRHRRAALQAAPVSIDRERLATAETLHGWGSLLADAILDRPFGDPDDDLAKLARRFYAQDFSALPALDRLSHPDPVSGPSWDTETRHLRDQEAGR